jgi:hypothetical protein
VFADQPRLLAGKMLLTLVLDSLWRPVGDPHASVLSVCPWPPTAANLLANVDSLKFVSTCDTARSMKFAMAIVQSLIEIIRATSSVTRARHVPLPSSRKDATFPRSRAPARSSARQAIGIPPSWRSRHVRRRTCSRCRLSHYSRALRVCRCNRSFSAHRSAIMIRYGRC